MQYKKDVYIDYSLLKKINGYLHSEPEYPEHCLGEDCTITETVKFENGAEVDIKCCGVQFEEGSSNTAWTEAVLFVNGCQVAYTEPESEFEGTWELEYNGDTYIVNVVLDPTHYQAAPSAQQ